MYWIIARFRIEKKFEFEEFAKYRRVQCRKNKKKIEIIKQKKFNNTNEKENNQINKTKFFKIWIREIKIRDSNKTHKKIIDQITNNYEKNRRKKNKVFKAKNETITQAKNEIITQTKDEIIIQIRDEIITRARSETITLSIL